MSLMKRLAKFMADACIFVIAPVQFLLLVGFVIWHAGMTAVYVIAGILLLAFLMAISMGSDGSGSYAGDDDDGWQHRRDDYNPATGLPMVGGVDTGGSPFGCDNHLHW